MPRPMVPAPITPIILSVCMLAPITIIDLYRSVIFFPGRRAYPPPDPVYRTATETPGFPGKAQRPTATPAPVPILFWSLRLHAAAWPQCEAQDLLRARPPDPAHTSQLSAQAARHALQAAFHRSTASGWRLAVRPPLPSADCHLHRA